MATAIREDYRMDALREMERRLNMLDQLTGWIDREMQVSHEQISKMHQAKDENAANWHGGYWNALARVKEKLTKRD